MREDLIEIENGTIITKDGTTLDIGKGWFVKEPPEEMIRYYENSEYWNGTWGGSVPSEMGLNISDMRWRLYKKLYHGGEFERKNHEAVGNLDKEGKLTSK